MRIYPKFHQFRWRTARQSENPRSISSSLLQLPEAVVTTNRNSLELPTLEVPRQFQQLKNRLYRHIQIQKSRTVFFFRIIPSVPKRGTGVAVSLHGHTFLSATGEIPRHCRWQSHHECMIMDELCLIYLFRQFLGCLHGYFHRKRCLCLSRFPSVLHHRASPQYAVRWTILIRSRLCGGV